MKEQLELARTWIGSKEAGYLQNLSRSLKSKYKELSKVIESYNERYNRIPHDIVHEIQSGTIKLRNLERWKQDTQTIEQLLQALKQEQTISKITGDTNLLSEEQSPGGPRSKVASGADHMEISLVSASRYEQRKDRWISSEQAGKILQKLNSSQEVVFRRKWENIRNQVHELEKRSSWKISEKNSELANQAYGRLKDVILDQGAFEEIKEEPFNEIVKELSTIERIASGESERLQRREIDEK